MFSERLENIAVRPQRASHHTSSGCVTMQLCRMSDLVQENLKKAQDKQKQWYDRNARERTFKKGDQVLILLPTSSKCLLAQWNGPYPVTKTISSVNYEVDMLHMRKRRRIFHVNMLRTWNPPMPLSLWTDVEEEHIDEVSTWKEDPSECRPVISEQLSNEQRQELTSLLAEFDDVLSNVPGKTDLVELRIVLKENKTICQPLYRLAHAYREMVQKELKEMLDAGIIEPSNSEWASPIVLVQKKDGTMRLCVDYRKLNSMAEADAYPMSRADELINDLGSAKFIST